LRDNVSAAQQQTRRSERGQRDQTDAKGSNARLLVETDTDETASATTSI
jgi:hypothetical protein